MYFMTNAYTPYGYARINCGVTGFNGECRDTVSGVYHLGNGHRLYNPRFGRFHSPDSHSPFGEGGVNAYAYCEGDPVNYQDTSGQSRWFAMAYSSARRITPRSALTVSVGTGLTAYVYQHRELVAEFVSAIKHSMIPGELTMKDASPARQMLDQRVAVSNRVFNRGLKITNRTLASNGNGSVGYRQAEKYVSDSWNEEWSDTFKFARSAGRWAEKALARRRPDAVAGAVMNSASAVLASAHDHTMYKMGGVFTEAYTIRGKKGPPV